VLFEYLGSTSYDDGSARRTSTLLVFIEDSRVKGCLNDRQEERSLWVTEDTLEDLLVGLEMVLAAGTGDWRKSKPSGKVKK
jgi:hypothetical protein